MQLLFGMIDTGASQRLAILKDDAERQMMAPLRNHGWVVAVEVEQLGLEYIIVSAARAGQTRRFALLYSSGTDNKVYRALEQQVDAIYFRGPPYMLEQFAHGLKEVPKTVSTFGEKLICWNRETTEGKFSPVDDSGVHAHSVPIDRVSLLSEDPIMAIWLRVRQLQSVTLAKKLVRSRASQQGIELEDDVLSTKAEGLAYVLRNAADYFSAADPKNVIQRVLNVYYGCMAFASAEMLASPKGVNALSDIEKLTVQGHGLHTLSGQSDSLESICVTPFGTGFFPAWIKFLAIQAPSVPEKKPRRYEDLSGMPVGSWIDIEMLFASIPELADLFGSIFVSKPRYVRAFYDTAANMELGNRSKSERSYIILWDPLARLTKQDLAGFHEPLEEIRAVASEKVGREFQAAVGHPGMDFWWRALKLHHSAFVRDSLIMPVFGTITEFRTICMILLYALSIIVRYRPSLWRRVQDGNLDHMRALIEAFLVVVERALPQEFLESVLGQPVSVHQPGSFWS